MQGSTGRAKEGSARSRSSPERGTARTNARLLPSSSRRGERRALARAARLLRREGYGEAAAILLGLEQEYERAGETVAAGALRLAHELCLACRTQHSEVEAHQRAADVAAGLERRLRERLTDTLALATTDTVAHAPLPGPASREERGKRRSGRFDRVVPSLAVYCLGPLRVYREGSRIDPWPNRRAKAVFKYLAVHRTGRKEVLMDLFWPDAGPAAARNNLNVAVYSLRQVLRSEERDFSYVLFQDDSYLLNPELDLWVDAAEFEQLVASADQLERSNDLPTALANLQTAETLYQGSLFDDDPYEEWILPRRRELEGRFLSVLERLREHYANRGDIGACTAVCRKMLAIDSCREDAHAELMRCYARQGQHHLALRQFIDCQEALRRELDTGPGNEVRDLHERVRQHQAV
jgi:DNA-binding SARP family transcriptional activator